MGLSEYPRQTRVISLAELQPNPAFSSPDIRYIVATDTVIYLHPYRGNDSEVSSMCRTDSVGNKYLSSYELKAGDVIWLQTPTPHQMKEERTEGSPKDYVYICREGDSRGHCGAVQINDLVNFKVEVESE